MQLKDLLTLSRFMDFFFYACSKQQRYTVHTPENEHENKETPWPPVCLALHVLVQPQNLMVFGPNSKVDSKTGSTFVQKKFTIFKPLKITHSNHPKSL